MALTPLESSVQRSSRVAKLLAQDASTLSQDLEELEGALRGGRRSKAESMKALQQDLQWARHLQEAMKPLVQEVDAVKPEALALLGDQAELVSKAGEASASTNRQQLSFEEALFQAASGEPSISSVEDSPMVQNAASTTSAAALGGERTIKITTGAIDTTTSANAGGLCGGTNQVECSNFNDFLTFGYRYSVPVAVMQWLVVFFAGTLFMGFAACCFRR